MRIVLLGKPGSGKGTQAGMLSSDYHLPHLSSGAMLRDEIKAKTPFGLRIEEYVMKGEIGPQELITDIVFDHLDRAAIPERPVGSVHPWADLLGFHDSREFAPEAIYFGDSASYLLRRLYALFEISQTPD